MVRPGGTGVIRKLKGPPSDHCEGSGDKGARRINATTVRAPPVSAKQAGSGTASKLTCHPIPWVIVIEFGISRITSTGSMVNDSVGVVMYCMFGDGTVLIVGG